MPGVDLILGPMLIGAMLNMILYGVMFIQMFTYHQHYANDSRWIRYFMLYLLLAATSDVVIEFHIIYDSLIIQNGTQAALTTSPKLLPGDAVLISFVSAPIQLFTAWRISVITGSFILPGFVVLLSMGSFGSGITVAVKAFLNPEFRSFQTFATEVVVWLVLSALCDIIIAAGMTYALYTRKTSFRIADGQIDRIIRLSVETGGLTAITALADVVLFLTFHTTTMNVAVDFPLSALYICSVLVMLNSRERHKTPDIEHAHSALQMPNPYKISLKLKPSLSRSGSKKSQTKVEIYTSTEQVVVTDNSDAASERALALHTQPDYYRYDAREADPPRTPNSTHNTPAKTGSSEQLGCP
ncbi:hypothetical protein DFH08DRAFT_1077118 [Mycena albidolilacea]|uniref:DUF6534 domain-containing protein n=1 Tax=Mycena albidolilacea TaxID=1033008 RepID=A0AAD7ABS2_9AGAR|nr:hypothetical protein DFH08DRAFT_1077118 [Mycena albidolilacea]